jgi:hemolysin III
LQVYELHPPSAWAATVSLFGTTLAVAMLDAYSDSIAEMLSRQRGLSRDELRKIGRDVAPVLVGAQGPTLLLLASAIGFLSVDDAIDLAQTVAFLSLFGYGWRIGMLLHEHWLRRLISGLILVAIGGFIVGIKAAFH